MIHNDTPNPENGAILTHHAAERPLDPTIRIVTMDENDLREWLLKLKSSAGFITELAPQLGISPQYLGDVLAGRKSFGPKLLEGMKEFGLVRAYQLYDVEIVLGEGIDE